MTHITLISGSTLGGAEYVAEHLAEKLQNNNYHACVHHGPQLSDVEQQGLWLLVTSTHGAGELPENIQGFYQQIRQQSPDLSNIRYGAIGIGSQEYDTFCAAIEKLDNLLTQCNAQRIGEILRINILDHDIPEDPAEQWLTNWITLL